VSVRIRDVTFVMAGGSSHFDVAAGNRAAVEACERAEDEMRELQARGR
jgi:hypothetical protein